MHMHEVLAGMEGVGHIIHSQTYSRTVRQQPALQGIAARLLIVTGIVHTTPLLLREVGGNGETLTMLP